MKTSHQALTTILGEIYRPTYIVFGYQSAKGNYLSAIAKINFDYKAELNAKQLADGQEVTEPGKRSWGVKVRTPTTKHFCGPLISHKGNSYLACWITETITHVDKDGQSEEPLSGYKDLKMDGIRTLVIAERVYDVE